MADQPKDRSRKTRPKKTGSQAKASKGAGKRAISAATSEAPTPAKAETVIAKPEARQTVTPEERWNMIAKAAYYRAEKRGFVGGDPAEDWTAAEAEIDAQLAAEPDK